jgi:hypothetical protein
VKLLALVTALTFSTTVFADLIPGVTQILEKLDSSCAGNDNGYIGKYDVKNYKTSDVLAKLRSGESEGACKSNISASRAEAIANLKRTLFSNNGDETSCVSETLTSEEQTQLAAVIDDPTNRAVFSKEWDGDSGDSEYCMYANYDIYRADGTLISIVFNHTD